METKSERLLLSIIIPMYNCEQYILGCLQSIPNLCVEESRYEVLIIDDGSVDNSARIVKQYIAGRSNFKYIWQENQGHSGARNHGLKLAIGQFVYFVDADDFFFKCPLDMMLTKAIENQLEMFSVGKLSGEESFLRKHSPVNVMPDRIDVFRGVDYLCGEAPFYCWQWIIRRDFLINSNVLFPMFSPAEDICFSRQLLIGAERVSSFESMILYAYVVRENSVTHSWGQKNYVKYATGVMSSVYFLRNIVDDHPSLPQVAKDKIKVIIDNSVLFLLIRAIRFYPKTFFREVRREMDEGGFIPIGIIPSFAGLKQNVLRFWVNNKPLYYLSRPIVYLISMPRNRIA